MGILVAEDSHFESRNVWRGNLSQFKKKLRQYTTRQSQNQYQKFMVSSGWLDTEGLYMISSRLQDY